MHFGKSLGPNGINVAFYKRFWYLCGPKIFATTLLSQKMVTFPLEVNCPYSPKLKPTIHKRLQAYIPIHVLYKIFSKTLANIIKHFLSKCIYEEQSTFIENHFITNNLVIASKLIHHIRCKTQGKACEIALKIDINKVFDRVDWNYLLIVMTKMGDRDKT